MSTQVRSFKNLFYVTAALFAAMILVIPVSATPQIGPADDSFYTVPSLLPPGSHGDIVWYRQAQVDIPGAPTLNAWNVLYFSTDSVGNQNVVTGTVMVPQSGQNGRILSYAVGTQGLSQMCAPSRQLADGTEYENANLVAVLKEGYTLLVTDNPGYTTGGLPSYMMGIAQGHACLDIIKAATQIPGAPVSINDDVVIWGYSQGGQTAAWAGELQPQYMPGIDLVAIAAGGVPADLIETGYNTDGKIGSSFLLQVVVGLYSQYPVEVPLYDLANAQGLEAIEAVQNMCVFESLFEYMRIELADLGVDHLTLAQLIDMYVYDPLMSQKLGSTKIDAPLYLYHGTSDEFIPLEPALQLKEAYCSLGTTVTFGVYEGEHITTQFQAAPDVLNWFDCQFNPWCFDFGTCITVNQRPIANNNPLDGDFIISLTDWPFEGSIGLKTLRQTVELPDDSNITVDANMDTNNLTGDLGIPTFVAPLWVTVIPVKVRLEIEAAGPMTGSVSLDNNGGLHIDGHQYINLAIDGVGLSYIAGIPIRLHGEDPVDIPINFDGPVSSLGDGSLEFTGTTTFPRMTGGLFSGLFTTLMSGPGQTYSFKMTPPDLREW